MAVYGALGPEKEIGAIAYPRFAPTVATMTQRSVQGTCVAEPCHELKAVVLTVNLELPLPALSVTPNGWPASCSPQPSELASAAEAHSERKNLPPWPNPVTDTRTFSPLCNPLAGVTTTFGLCVANAGTRPESDVVVGAGGGVVAADVVGPWRVIEVVVAAVAADVHAAAKSAKDINDTVGPNADFIWSLWHGSRLAPVHH